MALGHRLRHGTLRNCVVTVVMPTRPLVGRQDRCVSCQTVHTHKTVHLGLDDVGACIVSDGVLAQLREAGAVGESSDLLSYENEVTDPPTRTLQFANGDVREIPVPMNIHVDWSP